MPLKKISELDLATSIDGTEEFPLVQSGQTKRVVANKITENVQGQIDNIVNQQKEFIYPNFLNNINGTYRVDNANSTASAYFSFVIPFDFLTLVSLNILAINAGVTQTTADIDLQSQYGLEGEDSDAHSESNTSITYDLSGTSGQHISIDVSSVFTNLAAGHRCGLQVTHNSIGSTLRYMFIRGVYTS